MQGRQMPMVKQSITGQNTYLLCREHGRRSDDKTLYVKVTVTQKGDMQYIQSQSLLERVNWKLEN